MKNICLIIRSLAHGGAEKQCLMLAKALQAHFRTHLVILDTEPQHEKHLQYIAEQGISHHFLEGSFLQKLKTFRQFLTEQQIDILFTYLPSDTIFGAMAARLAKVPYVMGGIRNAEIEGLKKSALRWVHNHWLNYSISNSHVGKLNFIEYGFAPEKLLVLPNGLELQMEPIIRAERSPVKIVSVGRFVQQKDLETAIKTFQQLRKLLNGGPQVHLQLVGYGPLEAQVRKWIVDYGLSDHASVIISPPNVGEYYRDADIYLATSLVEGLSNSIMEAMSFSLPVVATDAGDNRQLIQNEENGFVMPLRDYEGLADSLVPLVKDAALRRRFGEVSFDRIQGNYTFDAFQRNYLQLINGLN